MSLDLRTPLLGVVVPAHDEEALLPGCLAALADAARHPALARQVIEVVVVADACTDATAALAAAAGVTVLELDAACVGAARRAGAALLVERGAWWLASTDADSTVGPGWLAAQLRLADAGADAVCGAVDVVDWSEHPPGVRTRFAASYQRRDGHAHVHGANLGVRTSAYVRAGGWSAVAAHEDVALVEELRLSGAQIAWSAAPEVRTSGRRDPRCSGGFGDHLLALGA